eukprot:6204445-Pleurochrysis_carterae.AAC.1
MKGMHLQLMVIESSYETHRKFPTATAGYVAKAAIKTNSRFNVVFVHITLTLFYRVRSHIILRAVRRGTE